MTVTEQPRGTRLSPAAAVDLVILHAAALSASEAQLQEADDKAPALKDLLRVARAMWASFDAVEMQIHRSLQEGWEEEISELWLNSAALWDVRNHLPTLIVTLELAAENPWREILGKPAWWRCHGAALELRDELEAWLGDLRLSRGTDG